MALEISGIDTKIGLDYCAGDLDIYLRVLRSYVLDITEVLDKMRNVSEMNLKNYAVYVHGIKSISEAVGAEEARKTALDLEELAKNGDFTGVQAKNRAFIAYLENLVTHIQECLKKHGES